MTDTDRNALEGGTRGADLKECPWCETPMWVLGCTGVIPQKDEVPFVGQVFRAHGRHEATCPIRDTTPFKTEQECIDSWGAKEGVYTASAFDEIF